MLMYKPSQKHHCACPKAVTWGLVPSLTITIIHQRIHEKCFFFSSNNAQVQALAKTPLCLSESRYMMGRTCALSVV